MDNDPNTKLILDKIAELEAKVDAQAEIISKVHRVQKLGIYSRYAYWTFIILAALGAFYFISPALESLGQLYGNSNDLLKVLDGGLNNLEGL